MDKETSTFKRSELFFQVGDSSTLVSVESPFGRLLFPKEALLISDQTHFYSSFTLASSSRGKSGSGSSFFVCFVFILNVWNSLHPPVGTIGRLHVARRALGPSSGAARAHGWTSAGWTLSRTLTWGDPNASESAESLQGALAAATIPQNCRNL